MPCTTGGVRLHFLKDPENFLKSALCRCLNTGCGGVSSYVSGPHHPACPCDRFFFGKPPWVEWSLARVIGQSHHAGVYRPKHYSDLVGSQCRTRRKPPTGYPDWLDQLLHVQMVDASRSIATTGLTRHGPRCCGPDRGPKPAGVLVDSGRFVHTCLLRKVRLHS